MCLYCCPRLQHEALRPSLLSSVSLGAFSTGQARLSDDAQFLMCSPIGEYAYGSPTDLILIPPVLANADPPVLTTYLLLLAYLLTLTYLLTYLLTYVRTYLLPYLLTSVLTY